jgi:hypothetical protein
MRGFPQFPPSATPTRLLSSPLSPSMDVIALTILVSSCLAGIFVACFAAEIRRTRRSSPERDSLLPLDSAPKPSSDSHHS